MTRAANAIAPSYPNVSRMMNFTGMSAMTQRMMTTTNAHVVFAASGVLQCGHTNSPRNRDQPRAPWHFGHVAPMRCLTNEVERRRASMQLKLAIPFARRPFGRKFYRDGRARRTLFMRQRDNALPGICTQEASEALSCCPLQFVGRQQRQRFRCHFGGLVEVHFLDTESQAMMLVGVLPSR